MVQLPPPSLPGDFKSQKFDDNENICQQLSNEDKPLELHAQRLREQTGQ